MKIDSYTFGAMKIDGRRYDSDLLICGSDIKANWWREEGHSLCREDLAWVLARDPDVLIIGTGQSGVMQVPYTVKEQLKKEGIKLIDQPTEQAVETFNQFQNKDKKLAAGFHLTC